MEIRCALPDDLPAIVGIYNHYVVETVVTFDREPVTVESRRPWFDQFDERHPLLVADDVGGLLGFAYYLPFRAKAGYDGTKESTVYVSHTAHRRGVGTALYQALLDHAQAAGVHALIGVLGGDNPPSVRLHERFGFELRGHLREVGFKHGGYVDTYYYERLLVTAHTGT